MSGVSVVVPVFNGAGSVRALAERLAAVLPGVAERFEVVLVNDGSTDGSWGVIEELAALHPWVRGVDLDRNYGQQAATLCGIRLARHELVVTMDDDLEHPPEAIPALLRRLGEGHDVVYGTAPPARRGWARGVGRAVMRPALFGGLGPEAARELTSLRAFRVGLRDEFARPERRPVLIDLLLARGARRVAFEPVEFGARLSGRSGYSLGKLLAGSLHLLVRARVAGGRGAAYAVRAETGGAR
ncbi:MAG TPA: glycosyltransferase family 2 protein [Longimicrobium sp.]